MVFVDVVLFLAVGQAHQGDPASAALLGSTSSTNLEEFWIDEPHRCQRSTEMSDMKTR